jgi:hypothetical protein
MNCPISSIVIENSLAIDKRVVITIRCGTLKPSARC